MRVARKFRRALTLDQLHRGYARLAVRPGSLRSVCLIRELPAGGVIVGPPGARRLALDIVRSEIDSDCYVTDRRLAIALARLIARL
jgi:hypothetical protein